MAPRRIVAYWGDPLLVERALARALAAWGPAQRVVLFGDDPCLDRLIGELGSADLFGEPRVIIVRRADRLVGEERLARVLAKELPPGVGLAFVGEALKGPVVRRAEEARFFPTPTGRALQALACELLAEADLPRLPFVVDLLLHAAAGDPLRLAQEVAKLSLWKGERLPPDRLPRLLFFTLGTPYAYLDAVGKGEIPAALAELRTLLAAGANPLALFFALVGHVRALLAALAAMEDGREPAGPTWLVRRRLDQAKRWGEGRLVALLASLQELDLRIKTGQLSPEAALHQFTLSLTPVGRG
ncbi:MAG TPA: hypothetical protein ENN53_01665 [Candidatus Acetothermia bacterium]|nr:hypothetical protein [Candidatus Acetothermia bacterium]